MHANQAGVTFSHTSLRTHRKLGSLKTTKSATIGAKLVKSRETMPLNRLWRLQYSLHETLVKGTPALSDSFMF